MYNTPSELLQDKIKGKFAPLKGIERTLALHMSLQIEYVLEKDINKRQLLIIDLISLDARAIGFFIGVGCMEFIPHWPELVDFGIGHTEKDLEKWRKQFKYGSS